MGSCRSCDQAVCCQWMRERRRRCSHERRPLCVLGGRWTRHIGDVQQRCGQVQVGLFQSIAHRVLLGLRAGGGGDGARGRSCLMRGSPEGCADRLPGGQARCATLSASSMHLDCPDTAIVASAPNATAPTHTPPSAHGCRRAPALISWHCTANAPGRLLTRRPAAGAERRHKPSSWPRVCDERCDGRLKPISLTRV